MHPQSRASAIAVGGMLEPDATVILSRWPVRSLGTRFARSRGSWSRRGSLLSKTPRILARLRAGGGIRGAASPRGPRRLDAVLEPRLPAVPDRRVLPLRAGAVGRAAA